MQKKIKYTTATPAQLEAMQKKRDNQRKSRAQWKARDGMPDRKPESANRITNNIIRVINMQPGCFAFRVNNVGVWDAAKGIYRKGNTMRGISDILACVRGRMYAIEVKAGKDVISFDQQKFMTLVTQSGGQIFVAHNTDAFIAWFTTVLEKQVNS
jgi:hypothetical protein